MNIENVSASFCCASKIMILFVFNWKPVLNFTAVLDRFNFEWSSFYRLVCSSWFSGFIMFIWVFICIVTGVLGMDIAVDCFVAKNGQWRMHFVNTEGIIAESTSNDSNVMVRLTIDKCFKIKSVGPNKNHRF